MRKRILSILVCISMVMALLPAAVYADGGDKTINATGENITITSTGYKVGTPNPDKETPWTESYIISGTAGSITINGLAAGKTVKLNSLSCTSLTSSVTNIDVSGGVTIGSITGSGVTLNGSGNITVGAAPASENILSTTGTVTISSAANVFAFNPNGSRVIYKGNITGNSVKMPTATEGYWWHDGTQGYEGGTTNTFDAGKTFTLTAKTVGVESVSIDESEYSVECGGTASFTAKVFPDNATDKTLNWQSSDTNVAEVANGIIITKKPGVANISATSVGGKSDSVMVTVAGIEKIELPSDITLTSGESADITPTLTVFGTPANLDILVASNSECVELSKEKINGNETVSITARSAGTATVSFSSEKYGVHDEIIVAVIGGAPVLSKDAITYGEAISAITLSGTMSYGGVTVGGSYTWDSPNAKPNAGVYTAAWTFTPNDTVIYQAVKGTSSITVKAIPTVTPTYSNLGKSGKTLADAGLGIASSSVAGQIRWILPSDTVVQRNVYYQWVFTPDDTANYTDVTGEIRLWRKSSSSEDDYVDVDYYNPVIDSKSGDISYSQIENIVNAVKKGATLKINTEADSIVLSGYAIKRLVENENGIEVEFEDGIITLDDDSLDGLDVRGDDDVEIGIAQIYRSSDDDIREELRSGAPVFEVYVNADNDSVHSFEGDIKLVIKYNRLNKFDEPVLKHFKSNGKIEYLYGRVNDSEFTVKDRNITLSYFSLIEEDDIVAEEKPKPKPEPEKEETADMDFRDVYANDWFYADVRYVYENGIMAGISNRYFEPDLTLSRAMIVAMLNRLNTKEDYGVKGSLSRYYSDVPSGVWYADDVEWASRAGIVSGYPNGKFMPGESVTREQLATILFNYAKAMGKNMAAGSGNLSRYNDGNQVSSYAVFAMNWAVSEGIITGKSPRTLDPKGTATRAEAAAMIHRFAEKIDK